MKSIWFTFKEFFMDYSDYILSDRFNLSPSMSFELVNFQRVVA